MSNNDTYNALIHTARWRRLRHAYLAQHPLCERCKQEGQVTAATEVHHRTPVETAIAAQDMERLMFNSTNLQALCSDCHHTIHRAINTRSKEGAQRRTQQHLAAFTEKFI